jgi:hypothetical protein
MLHDNKYVSKMLALYSALSPQSSALSHSHPPPAPECGFAPGCETRSSALPHTPADSSARHHPWAAGLQKNPAAQGQTTFTLIGIGSNNLDVSALGVFQNLVSLKTMWPHSFSG